MKNIYDYQVKKADGTLMVMNDYTGKVMLIVNVASGCGFTPQYEALENLYEKYGQQGLIILGFPCNQFGNQESGSNSEIQSFCQTKFGIKFPIFAKIDVNGKNADPLFNFLKENARGIFGTKRIKWNFTKFLVGRNGQVLQRFSPRTKPEALVQDIEKTLASGA